MTRDHLLDYHIRLKHVDTCVSFTMLLLCRFCCGFGLKNPDLFCYLNFNTFILTRLNRLGFGLGLGLDLGLGIGLGIG